MNFGLSLADVDVGRPHSTGSFHHRGTENTEKKTRTYLDYGDHLAEPRRNFALSSRKRILVRQIPNKPPYCIHGCYVEKTVLNDLNSLNVINLKFDPLAILAVLNSRLISFWFALKFGKL